jgi:hypothetical protein
MQRSPERFGQRFDGTLKLYGSAGWQNFRYSQMICSGELPDLLNGIGVRAIRLRKLLA